MDRSSNSRPIAKYGFTTNVTMLEESIIDPELKTFFREYHQPLPIDRDLEGVREFIFSNRRERNSAEPKETLVVLDKVVELEGRREPTYLRLYYPQKMRTDTLPLLMWMHGGGFFLGNNKQDDKLLQTLSNTCGCVVVSVDYRLAPEYPYPAGLEDCYAALKWIYKSVEEIGVDASRIAIGGASAGACLAAALALRLRDEGGPPIMFQLLMIPVLDDRHETPSSQTVTDPRVWSRQLSLKAWTAYLKDVEGTPPAYAAPARSNDLSRLPPTFVSVEDQDLLRDEGIAYANRLMQSGVVTELHVYPGTFHGSVGYTEAEVSRRHIRDVRSALKRAFWGTGN